MWLIPHYFQSGEEACGPACLRMLAAAFGKQCNEQTVAEYCRIDTVGCFVNDLRRAAQALGLATSEVYNFDERGDEALLSQNVPFIAAVNWGILQGTPPTSQSHYVVALELVNNEVVFHDPADGPSRRVGLEDFTSAWRATGYPGIRVWVQLPTSIPAPC